MREIKTENYAICDFCNKERGRVIDIDANLTIVICKDCETRMEKENKKYSTACNICGEACVNCSSEYI